MVATYYAAAGFGRVGRALLGGGGLAFGIVGTGVTSAAITAFSLASLLWGLRGWHKD